MIVKICFNCKKEFERPIGEKRISNKLWKERKFCSHQCYWKFSKLYPNKGTFKKGIIPWIKGKKGITNYWLGKKRSQLTKNKISNTKKGKKLPKGHPFTIKGKIPWNKGLKGWTKKYKNAGFQKKHQNYNLGGKKSNQVISGRNDTNYKRWVKDVKKRDNNTCRINNKDCFGYNIVHHIKSWSAYPKLRYKVSNGITLCQAHHPRKRAEEKRLIPVFQELVSVSSE